MRNFYARRRSACLTNVTDEAPCGKHAFGTIILVERHAMGGNPPNRVAICRPFKACPAEPPTKKRGLLLHWD